MSHGNRPPQICDPQAPASKAAGTSKASVRARFRFRTLVPPATSTSAAAAPRCARGGDGGAADARDGLDRIIELEVLDALLLEVFGRGGESRIYLAVILDDVVADRRLVDQMAPEIGLAQPRPRLVIRVG